MPAFRPFAAAAAALLAACACHAAFAAEPAPLVLNNAPNTAQVPFSALSSVPVKDAAKSPECQADAAKLCSGIEPGRRRIGECLHANQSRIASAQCRKTVAEAEIAYDKAWPCHVDAKRFCQNTLPGEGRLGKCLSENSAKLGAQCSAFRRRAAQAAEASPTEVNKLQSLGAAPVWNESLR